MPNIFIPVDNKTWATHFSTRSWTCIQDQIDDGYPYYLQPVDGVGFVEFQHDFGALIASSTLITLSYGKTEIDGTVDLSVTLSASPDGTTWTDFDAGVTRVYASNFRYVKVYIEGTPADDTSFCKVQDVRVILSVKEHEVSGTGTTGVGGTVDVDITGEFLDVSAIEVTAEYNASYAVVVNYEFDGMTLPPTTITVHSYRGDTGAVVGSAGFSYKVKGVKA